MELYENMITKQLTAHLVPTSLEERMLSDGSFEELPQSACNDMNECVFEKMEPGTEEGITLQSAAVHVAHFSTTLAENSLLM